MNGNLNLSRAIGDLKYKLNAELPPKDQIITAEPDVRSITLTPEDRFFLLACDGIWDVMTNQARAAVGYRTAGCCVLRLLFMLSEAGRLLGRHVRWQDGRLAVCCFCRVCKSVGMVSPD